ncbi:MAG: hypothetical protein J6T02_03625, partial [Bacteroidales bacterium]|nr:hypothetical protein [Bacteroidales bacterium]
MKGKVLKYLLALLVILSLAEPCVFAQRGGRRARGRRNSTTLVDSTLQDLPDSVRAVRDSIARADSLFRADSLAMLSKSSLERPAFSTAKDSIIEVFSDGQRKIYYYGDVTVNYKDMKLTADYMEYDMNTGTVFAKGTYDEVNDEWKGQPVMEQGGKTYKMET